MNLLNLVHRASPPEPWVEGDKIPFRPAEAQHVLRKAYAALTDGGRLLLEVSTFAAVQRQGQQHSISTQAYTDEQYRYRLQAAGFADITFYSSLIGQPDERQQDFIAIVAGK